ncbi:hypothetical protein AeMF1_020883 [Aphanomyces euteiches]|nr:hypothetical protein AeMF1_020883 [Aphanomyces euteiches]KAH9187057.1 hypothetical protein AeNC1_010965 [Aphanomyces euteiches]
MQFVTNVGNDLLSTERLARATPRSTCRLQLETQHTTDDNLMTTLERFIGFTRLGVIETAQIKRTNQTEWPRKPIDGGRPLSMACINSSAYKFGVLPEADLPALKQKILDRAAELSTELFGTILLTTEGVNIRLSGPAHAVQAMQSFLSNDVHANLTPIVYKDSYTDTPTLRKFLVRIKREVISMGMDNVNPAVDGLADHIAPEEFKEWMDQDKDMLILDTRNDYELRLGTFDKAVDLNIKSFRSFPQEAKTQLKDVAKDKPIVMFCTGGVRCEKAAYALQQDGYTNVYQLDGGILNYFDKCGGAHYRGDCYIYDDRVAITPDLKPAEHIRMCYVCRNPLTAEEQASPEFVENVSCPYCFGGKRCDFRSM